MTLDSSNISRLVDLANQHPDNKLWGAIKNNNAVLGKVLQESDPQKLTRLFLSAVQDNDPGLVNYLIQQKNIDPKYALDKAIEWQWGDVNLVQSLMNNYGVKPDTGTIHLAAHVTQNNGSMILNNVLYHADYDQKTAALLTAIQNNDVSFANYLIQQKNIDPKYALDKAIEWQWGDVNLVQSLMNNYGAKPDAGTIHMAAYITQNNGSMILENVLYHADYDQKTTALLTAIQNNDVSFANYLIQQKNIDPNYAIQKAYEGNLPIQKQINMINLYKKTLNSLVDDPIKNNITENQEQSASIKPK